CGLALGHRLERLGAVPAREDEKRFLRRSAMRQISFQNALDDARCVFSDNVAVKLATERGVRAEAAADENVIALDRIVVFVRLNLAGEQTDLRYKMLRTGMVAAGQMNIDRRVERNARLAPGGDVLGVTFGVGGREFAARVSSARDETGTERIRMDGKIQRLDRVLRLFELFS